MACRPDDRKKGSSRTMAKGGRMDNELFIIFNM